MVFEKQMCCFVPGSPYGVFFGASNGDGSSEHCGGDLTQDALMTLLSYECFATKEAAAAGVAMYFNRGGQAPATKDHVS